MSNKTPSALHTDEDDPEPTRWEVEFIDTIRRTYIVEATSADEAHALYTAEDRIEQSEQFLDTEFVSVHPEGHRPTAAERLLYALRRR